MARSDEQIIHDEIVTDLLFWRKYSGGKLLHDPKCATNIGKFLAVDANCAKLQEIRDRRLAVKPKE